MFHARHLLTQTNLSILKYSNKNLIKLGFLNYSANKLLDTDKTNYEIKISEDCVKRLKELKSLNKYLRVTVDSGGCSGFEYKFSLDTKITEEDKTIEKDDCKVIVDKETIDFIKGATIDYYEELIRSGFRIINNPNSEQGCSCGSSFSVKI